MRSGELFSLDGSGPPYYLQTSSALGHFLLSSDAVVPTFRWLALVIDRIPAVEREEFQRIGYTIGGMMIFPAQRVDDKMTINGARGWHPRIKDRFDLTLECIRRHYVDEPSPLTAVLARYADFFGLFGDFAGYVEFFHLQDVVDESASTIKFFIPFADFTSSPVPATIDAYLDYRHRAIEFIQSRNQRIAAYVAESPPVTAARARTWGSRSSISPPASTPSTSPREGATGSPTRSRTRSPGAPTTRCRRSRPPCLISARADSCR